MDHLSSLLWMIVLEKSWQWICSGGIYTINTDAIGLIIDTFDNGFILAA